MIIRSLLFLTLTVFMVAIAHGQKINYSEPEREDSRRMIFEIVGKIGGNFQVYKNVRNRNYVVLFDNDMQQIRKVYHDYMPEDKLINVDFFNYPDHSFMIYQYQKKNTIYCMSVKVDAQGEKVGEPVLLDTSHIGVAASNKIYNAITNEDKSEILIFKINSKNKSNYLFTSLLFNDKMELLKKSRLHIPMEERNDYLDEFHLDNDGDLIFARFLRNNNDNITEAGFYIKRADADSFLVRNFHVEERHLDEIHIKVDNFRKRYFFTSFFYKLKKGNIDGFYFYIWDKQTEEPVLRKSIVFSEELKKEARGDANQKMAFNDFFIRNIIIKKDGGFVLGSESFYTTSRSTVWNRYDYLYGSPVVSPLDYYSYSNSYYNSWWWRSNRFGAPVRYHADNIVFLSFSKEGDLEWTNVISKEQFDDESDNTVSYQIMNTGGEVHVLFNQEEKRSKLLNDYEINREGQISRNPTLKNLDKGYEFMPKYAKQVSAKQMIMPCFFRNYICFAKIDYN